MGQDLKERDVKECSSRDSLQYSIGDVSGYALLEVGEADPDGHPDRRRQREDEGGTHKVLDRHPVGLGQVQAQRERHDPLVNDDGHENLDELGVLLLEPDGQALEYRVERQCHQEDQGPEG